MTNEDGRRFYYVCPKCGKDVDGCPDPACQEERVGHHVDKDTDCDFDVVLTNLEIRYD